jgi:uncharacterized protein involved in exopolysaccharide biosynthesis
MLGLIAAVLRHWRSVLLFAALVALAVVIPTLLKRRLYEVTTSFVPQTRKSAGNLSGIAAQLGINFPQSEGGQTPQFYAELLKSSEMLRNVVTAKDEPCRGGGDAVGRNARGRSPAEAPGGE